jgi:hypothetical protein
MMELTVDKNVDAIVPLALDLIDRAAGIRRTKGMEMRKETHTDEQQFTSEVGTAIDHVLEDVEFACETANLDFARAVGVAAMKQAMRPEQVKGVLTNFGEHTADISIGPGRQLPGSLSVVEMLFSAYDSLLGAHEANTIHKRITETDQGFDGTEKTNG